MSERAPSGPREPAMRWTFVVLAVLALAGAGAISMLDGWLARLLPWVQSDPEPPSRLWMLLCALAASVSLPFLAAAAYMWTAGGAVARSGRFPPPGYRLLAGASPLSQRSAAVSVRLLRVFGAAAATVAVMFPIVLWRLGRVLAAGLR